MSYTQTLRKIGDVAHNLVSLLDQFSTPPPATLLLPSEPTQSFPQPPSIVPQLTALGLERTLVDAVSQAYIKAAFSLKEKCEAEYDRSCSAFISVSDNRGFDSSTLRFKYRDTLLTRYQNLLSLWAQEAIDKAKVKVTEKKFPPLLSKTIHKPSITEPALAVVKRPGPCMTSPTQLRPMQEFHGHNDRSPFDFARPSYAFPCVYPSPVSFEGPVKLPPAPPLSISIQRTRQPQTVEYSIESCIEAFSRLRLTTSPRSASSRLRTAANSNPPLSEFANTTYGSPKVDRDISDKSHPHSPPPTFKFPSKIMSSDRRPALPILDTSLPVVVYKPSNLPDQLTSLTSHLTSCGVHPSKASHCQVRKLAPLPRRMHGLPKNSTSRSSSTTSINSSVSVSSLRRTPSLTSESDCESSSSSPFLGPITPPSSHSNLHPVLPESSQLGRGLYHAFTPEAGPRIKANALNASPGSLTSSELFGMYG